LEVVNISSKTGPDESQRLRVITRVFDDQHDWSADLGDGATARLLVGADGQDDCCVFRLAGSQELVVGSDYVRGPKFRLYELGLLNEFDLGWYLATANLSDIAAMGAHPIGLLTVVRYTASMSDESFESVLTGIRDASAQVGVLNVGGDTGSAERLILSGTALGIARPGASLLRSGASPGDIVCVTGPTGAAGAALRCFSRQTSGVDAKTQEVLLSAWKRPRARVAEGLLLGESGVVTACIDTSDGLKGALEAIAERSGVGFVVDEAAVPFIPEVAQAAKLLDESHLELVLGDSVDFQLVATVAPENLEALLSVFAEADLALYPIGVASEEPELVLRTVNGTRRPLPGKPWRHSEPVSATGPATGD
jgi:thiamine-monophosphate kinase